MARSSGPPRGPALCLATGFGLREGNLSRESQTSQDDLCSRAKFPSRRYRRRARGCRSEAELHSGAWRDAARFEAHELLVLLVGEVVHGQVGLEFLGDLPHCAHVEASVDIEIHIPRGDGGIE